ncbi:TadE/TadG family type IV pilus assembly protein [Bifidobacterium choloepi]|uniref:Pilus assembly protein n=1 Tax=Bifidobacterium choloepi TaxID=2614131 RepID=A0A6I5MYX7_9BIFI|nr:TadE family protein [Bifidobacterium choloepi]NEG69838.1 pilus assembly protein [Bifidobacterium choloepi]
MIATHGNPDRGRRRTGDDPDGRQRFRDAPRREDDGAATAEFAVVMPMVIVLASLLLYMARASVVSMECQEAAANVARVLVLQGDNADVEGIAQSSTSTDVQLAIATAQDTVTVTTTCAVVPDPLHVLPTTVTVTAVNVRQ